MIVTLSDEKMSDVAMNNNPHTCATAECCKIVKFEFGIAPNETK